MTNFFKFTIILLLIFFASTSFIFSKNSGTRIILAGHLYPIEENEKKLKKFINKINSYNPDLVFILGDSNLHNLKTIKKLKNLINSNLYFSPGNQELNISKSKYLKNVGYLNKLIELKDIRIILLNSSDNLTNIKKNLKNLLKNKYDNGPTILLTHHRIWDDTLLSQKSNEHDKSYYFKDIYPIIKNKIDYIFSGNSKRQYFRDLTDQLSYGKQNINNIFWMDKIGTIKAYSIGMGDGHPKANFTVVDVINKDLLVSGDYSTVENYDILPNSLIKPNKLKLSKKYSKDEYFFINKKKSTFFRNNNNYFSNSSFN